MKKFFTLFVLAIFACLNAAAQIVPENGKQYVIKNVPTGYYIVLATGSDSKGDATNVTAASLGAVGTAFTFTGTTEGFTLQSEDGDWFGTPVSNDDGFGRVWNVSTMVETTWMVQGTESAYYIMKNTMEGLGLDGTKIGSGIYTDKKNGERTTWVFEEYVAPEVTHTVTATVDGTDYKMLENGDGGYIVNVSVETGDHTLVVYYDGEEVARKDFKSYDFKTDDGSFTSGVVSIIYNDGEVTLEGPCLQGGSTPEPTPATFKGVVVPSLTSISSLAELDGIQFTFVDAEEVSLLEECSGFYVQNEDGSEVYALWNPDLGGTCEANGNVVTFHNFYVGDSEEGFAEIPAGTESVYFEDYESFAVSNADEEWDGYFVTFSIAYEGAPAPAPFQLIVKNNGVVCPNGEKVAAAEVGVAVDFYFENEGLTVANAEAAVVLYKENSPLTLAMTRILADGVSFMGGASQMQEPGTYLLEIPAGTYTDAAGNENVAYYGQWVIVESTGIDNVTLNTSNKVYDLQGRRVVAPSKGLYIVNGTKVVR